MAVRLRLKGIKWVRRELADGTVKEYAYLGRGKKLYGSKGGAIAKKRGKDSSPPTPKHGSITGSPSRTR